MEISGFMQATFCLFLLQLHLSHCEVFTALATLTKSLYHEKELAQQLREYVDAEKTRLDKVLQLAASYETHAETALQGAENYLANPINAFQFVKRFTTDLEGTQALLEAADNKQKYWASFSSRREELPTDEDLQGVIDAILRLQDTYNLTTSAIVSGSFTRANETLRLSADDSFQIGKGSYYAKNYYYTIWWMYETIRLLQHDRKAQVKMTNVLDHLAFALFSQGNTRRAMLVTQELLKIDPEHERAISNMVHFRSLIEKEENDLKAEGKTVTSELPPLINERSTDWYRKSEEFLRYEALCRGEDLPEHAWRRHVTLSCYYTTNGNNPLLILSPVKVEEYGKDPLLLLYHDVVSDTEIEEIKKLATPRLNRATVNDPTTGKLVHAHYRVSRSAWLKDEHAPLIARITRRIEAITNLDQTKSEELQVVNYGIGGQYEPHFDFARKRKPEEETFGVGEGNRIATWMFYFSEPDAGGYTVFTDTGYKVPPRKGAAGFWYNLMRSGDGDTRTRHAGCPVLSGSKWVANKWIHERGQEFRRICSLSEYE